MKSMLDWIQPCVSQTEAVAKPKDIIITIGPKEVAGIGYTTPGTSQEGGNERAHRMATTICPMVAFGKNQRNNSLQLHNTVRLFACGASERVHEYMNYIGLSSLHSTALSALKTLAVESAETLKSLMKVKNNPLIAPSICINNIDIEQHVHQVSVGNLSNIVRGTWGYIHVPNQRLLKTLNASEISLGAYQRSLESIKGMGINPSMFLPTIQEEQSEINVIKSQISRVLSSLADPKGKVSAYPTKPCEIELISHEPPELHMLKLMDALDNSAKGVGQVFESIMKQAGLSVEGFFGRFQPMDGDLGTVKNFNCLRAQQAPSKYPENRLDNMLFQLGASHTLWNVGSSIFTLHFTNCGAWQHLEALGFPAEKAIQKKDFTLMINQMERLFEDNVYHFLR
ncbi:hypothetical protein PCASD_05217 [Puccinia coronata f. sp. avenae]|uniref:DUF6589 domain-containing protein n=1 Tax=Puccinia coronata f. sp. avenae TaxID=200324 RepID=A0A2N5TGV9_9BASI|nr:hypothetical protein PCASD_05217 [Puccinia coronata f. sp. avenae]